MKFFLKLRQDKKAEETSFMANESKKIIDEHLAGVLSLFEDRLKTICGSSLKKVILYGSHARGDFDDESDVDLFLLIDGDPKQYEQRVYDLAAEFLVDHETLFSIVLENKAHFDKYLDVLPYFQSVRSEGIEIYG